jgi:phytoene synthase
MTEALKSVLRHDADMSECRELLRKGSHSFYAASLLLPSVYREPITALYAFCRVADDAVDLADDPAAGLDELHRRLDRIYAGTPQEYSVDRMFSDVVLSYNVPYALPAGLLDGFRWDVEGREYETLSDTYAYSARAAGTVGAMMAILMGVRDREVLGRATDLGIAMQLTNICRDVGEDARAGRVYLPADRLRANGVDVEAWRAAPMDHEGVRQTVREVLAVADDLYERSEWGISQLPARVRPAMFAARSIYAEIGRAIEARDHDSVSARAWVRGRRKAQLLAQAMRDAFETRRRPKAPALEEALFIIDAVDPMASA